MSSGVGYITGNGLSTYPFEDGEYERGLSKDPTGQLRLWKKCFVDASIMINSTSIPDGGWPTVSYGYTQARHLIFDLSVCGTRKTLHYAPKSGSSQEYPIFSGKEDWGWYTFTLSTEAINNYTMRIGDYLGDDGDGIVQGTGSDPLRLCARCVTLKPKELTSIRVYDGVQSKSSGPHFVLSGDVNILPGYNMQLAEPESETGVELNAVAGAGLGVIPCECTKSERSASPIFSSDGHSRMFNDTCYDIEPYVRNGKGYLKIHAKCTACCTCDMYASIVNDKLVPIAESIRNAKSALSDMLSKYEDNVRRFNRRVSTPTLDDVTLSLSGMPVGRNVGVNLGGSKITGRMGRCAFTATLRNASYATLIATGIGLVGTADVIDVSGTWEDANGDMQSFSGGSQNSFLGRTFSIGSGHSLVVTYVSRRSDKVSAVNAADKFVGRVMFALSYRTSSGTRGSLGTITKQIEV